jgi:hypothetical protein
MDFCVLWVWCQAEVSASCRSLIQRSPTDFGVSECDREASIMRRPWPNMGCCVMEKKLLWNRSLKNHYVLVNEAIVIRVHVQNFQLIINLNNHQPYQQHISAFKNQSQAEYISRSEAYVYYSAMNGRDLILHQTGAGIRGTINLKRLKISTISKIITLKNNFQKLPKCLSII